MAFEVVVTARFFEIDRAGIVFFGRIFEYCHVAYEELLGKALGSMEEAFRAPEWGTPLVHAEADFNSPIRLGDRITVALTLDKVGERSLSFGYRLTGEDGVLRATAKLVHAVIDPRTFRAIPAPASLLDALRRAGVLD
jgi:YbgC/YbaW family acyl-CoA thioester hydrolase